MLADARPAVLVATAAAGRRPGRPRAGEVPVVAG